MASEAGDAGSSKHHGHGHQRTRNELFYLHDAGISSNLVSFLGGKMKGTLRLVFGIRMLSSSDMENNHDVCKVDWGCHHCTAPGRKRRLGTSHCSAVYVWACGPSLTKPKAARSVSTSCVVLHVTYASTGCWPFKSRTQTTV